MLVENKPVSLIFKKIEGRLNGEEEAEFQTWLSESTKHREYFSRMKMYHEHYSRGEVSAAEVDDGWKNLVKRTDFRQKNRKRTMLYRFIAVAACVLVVFSVVRMLGWEHTSPVVISEEIVPGKYSALLELADGKTLHLGEVPLSGKEILEGNIRLDSGQLSYISPRIDTGVLKVEYNRLSVPRGGEYQLKLADGTKVWLNSDTRLKYPVAFRDRVREVFLEGEAYFDVEKEEKRPFVIHAGKQLIKVLGTEFGVSCYTKETCQSVTLVEGQVEVVCPEAGQHIVLQPGEQLVYDRSENTLDCKKVDVQEFVAWKDGKYVFSRKRLEDMLNTLSRWYDFEVFYQNEACKESLFSGEIRRFENFSDILRFIEKSGDIKFIIKERMVIVSK